MIKVESNPQRGEITIHADDDGVALLREMVEDMNRNGPAKA